MALLPTTGLESHPIGTTGINGILNANWERIEDIFVNIAADSEIGWDGVNLRFKARNNYGGLTSSSSIAIDANGPLVQKVTLSANTTFTTANLVAGRRVTVAIVCDGTGRTLTWPVGWTWVGATAPGSIAASKTGLLEIIPSTTANSGVIARWTVQA